MRMNYGYRRERLLNVALGQAGVGALLVTDPANVTWLTGFSGSNSAVLLLPDRHLLATDERYEGQAQALADDIDIMIDSSATTSLVSLAVEAGELTLGFEAEHVSVSQLRVWETLVNAEMPLVAVGPIAERLRAVKTSEEIELLRQACAITTMALESVTAAIRVGMSELRVARMLEARMGELGADDRSFPTIAAAGANSAIPHHHPTTRQIEAGDLLKLDFGARYGGYHADCTRMFVVGAAPREWQLRLHELVAQAAAAARVALAAGVAVIEVDAAARSVIAAAGYSDNFGHGTGHGVGLRIHEAPLIAARGEGVTAVGNVVTIEPGIYLPGRGGVRIEDVCVVEPDGIEVLTHFPRELRAIG